MKQLSNQDAGFIYGESNNTPMHIAGVGIYNPSTAPGGRLGHKDILKYVQDRIHFAPTLRHKLVEVPMGLDRPYWIEDPDFDIEFHIRHIALPQPGDWRQLCILLSRLHSRPLDLSRPLWEAYIIEGLDKVEGLPKGSFAIMVKIHHAAVDGTSGQAIFAALHDLTADAQAVASDKPLTVERPPTNIELLIRSLSNNIKRPLTQTKAVYKTAPKMLRNALKAYRGKLPAGSRLKVPDTRFNKSLEPHRVFEGVHFSLDDIKAIKNQVGHGSTVNDVMLAIVAEAMQTYLTHHGEEHTESFCAMLPQDLRQTHERNDLGNKVGGLFADLHSNIKNPVERLIAIHTSTSEAKEFALAMDTAAIVQNYMGGFLNPNLGKSLNRLMQNTRLLERAGPLAANALITNIPGPNFPLYHAGAEMVAYWGIPPVLDCIGLGHAIFSYNGRISVSALACRSMMPDPAFYAQCLKDAFEHLKTQAEQLPADFKEQEQTSQEAKTTEIAEEKPTKKRSRSAQKPKQKSKVA